jgi:hypothetical protein
VNESQRRLAVSEQSLCVKTSIFYFVIISDAGHRHLTGEHPSTSDMVTGLQRGTI